ncbi:MAG: PAS domain-containing protein, partial [Bacteroidales bacterium]|nr:PAS domain-containing protein [Bacteroidales bacterium]
VSFCVNNQFYVREWGKGLLKLVNDSLKLIPGSEQFENERVYVMLPYEEDKILIVARKHGVFIYTESSGFEKPRGFEKVDNFLIKNQIYSGTKLNNEYFVLGTVHDGLIIIDKTGNILRHINKKNGLQDNSIWKIYTDSRKNIWTGLNDGISYITINSPFSLYDDKAGLLGAVYSTINFRNTLYIGTSLGVFCKDHQNNFTMLENTKGQSWYLSEIQGELYSAHYEGILKINGNTAENVAKISNTWTFLELVNHPGYFIAGTSDNGLILLEYKNKKLTTKHKIKGFDESSRWVKEDNNGNIWVTSEFKGVYRLKLNETLDSVVKLDFYNSDHGLPANTHNFVFKIKTANQNTRIVFGTEKGIYKFNQRTNRFVPDKVFNKLSEKEESIDKFVQDCKGNIYYQQGDEKGVLLFQTDSTYKIKRTPFLKYKGLFIENICIIDSTNIFFCSKDGIITYNPRILPDYNVSFPVLMRQVFVNDSLIFGGTKDSNDVFELPYKQHNLQFAFSALYFEDHHKTQYSYKLEGYNKNWSEWSLKTEKEYTNLPEGNYIFKVKAKNIYDKESTITQYRFVILAPWYRTIIAYIIYGISTFFLIWLIVKLYTINLKREKDNLEKVVKERTIEIFQQKEEIIAQSEHVASVNRELEKLSIIVQETDNAVILARPDGQIEWVNEGFYKLYKYSLSRFIDKKGNNIFTTSSNPDIKNIVKRCLNQKESITYENRVTDKTDKIVWIQTTLTPIINNKGEAEKLIAIDTDITKLKEAENEILKKNEEILAQNEEILTQKDELEIHRNQLEKLVTKRTSELEKAKVKAEESDHLKSAFLANMSHEIRTPMNAIIGLTYLAKLTKLTQQQYDYLVKIEASGESLLGVINDILDFSKIEAGRLTMESMEFYLEDVLDKVGDMVSMKADEKGLELVFAPDSKVPEELVGDPLRLGQILINLVGNAIKFTEKG